MPRAMRRQSESDGRALARQPPHPPRTAQAPIVRVLEQIADDGVPVAGGDLVGGPARVLEARLACQA
jgi:hypothetical protein